MDFPLTPAMEEQLECLQCPPTERRTWFCAQIGLYRSQLFVEIEKGDPANTACCQSDDTY